MDMKNFKKNIIWALGLVIASILILGKGVPVSAQQAIAPATAGGDTLQKGKWASHYIEDGASGYYKIKVPSSGCLKIEMKPSDESRLFNLTLLNGKKAKISDDTYETEEVYYGVKKGTYYIKVDNKGSEGEVCSLRYTFEKIKLNKNTKRSKAADLKKGKKVKGILLCGSKKNWHDYKVEINTKKIKLTIQLNSNFSECKFTYYRSGDFHATTLTLDSGKNTWKMPMEKGTYYFTISTDSKSNGGSYSLQWK